jgi:hypothetical protein
MMLIAAPTVILREGHTSTAILLITAGAGVVGALVGGLVSGVLSLRGERSRQKFAREMEEERQRLDAERETTVMRGALRLLCRQFIDAENACTITLGSGFWWPRKIPFEVDLPLDDQKLIASSLSAKDWLVVDGARGLIERVKVIRAHAPDLKPDGTLPPIDENARSSLQILEARLEPAIKLLRQLEA